MKKLSFKLTGDPDITADTAIVFDGEYERLPVPNGWCLAPSISYTESEAHNMLATFVAHRSDLDDRIAAMREVIRRFEAK